MDHLDQRDSQASLVTQETQDPRVPQGSVAPPDAKETTVPLDSLVSVATPAPPVLTVSRVLLVFQALPLLPTVS